MRLAALLFILWAVAPGSAFADAIVFPATPPARGQPLDVVYRLASPADGRGVLRLEWRDSTGRIVERRRIRFALHGGTDVAFHLDTARAAAIQNRLRVHLSFDGRQPTGAPDRREADVTASFVVPPPSGPWWDYQIIMWQPQTAAGYAALAKIGVSAGLVQANRAAPRQLAAAEVTPIVQNDLRFYVENIATDFYSAYHRWDPGHAVNWRFLEAQKLARSGDPAAFRRDPSLSDPRWLKKIHDRLVATVETYRPYRPLYYNLADESGIADLAAYWDFDVSDPSLAAMRQWLKTQYPDLAALNREWGSDFPNWSRVVPPTTTAAMQQTDENFAAWADFKAWMDVAFARALRMGRDAVHEADPHAYAAMEGVQVPGWGGYDYSRLAQSVDVMETGDQNFDLIRSLAPHMILLSTSFDSGKAEARQVWRAWLEGARGLILWDDNHQFVDSAGVRGSRGLAAAPYFRALRDGLGALVIDSRRLISPVAILYSPASMRAQWMLDWKDKGNAWTRRGSAAEGGNDNTVRSAMSAYALAIKALGFEPRFIAAASLEKGALRRGDCRVLILPHAIALSPAGAGAIRRFVSAGGTVIADSEPGRFDAHVKRLDRPLLSDVFRQRPDGTETRFAVGQGRAVYLAPDPPAAGASAHFGPDGLMRLRALFEQQRVAPAVKVTAASGAQDSDVDVYAFRDGAVTIVGLRQPSAPAPVAAPIVLSLPRKAFVYDLRAQRPVFHGDRLRLRLDPFEPTLLALSPRPLPRPTLSIPAPTHPGATAVLRISFAGSSGAAFHVLHVTVMDPSGRTDRAYSGNIRMRRGGGAWRIPLALNDPVGTWRVRVTDALSGLSATAAVRVLPR
ncbi:MAG TPA: alpha-amylase family protein [Stellaceae bacterium]|nr:alpha-amylase family protein [Stellaceae bacterium]